MLGGDANSWKFPESIIFGIDSAAKIMGETSRAWLRHAVRWWYAAMTHIDKQGGVFSAIETLERALHGFRGAVTRWAMSIRAHYVARKFTKLTGIVAEDERAKYNKLISIEKNGQYHLSPTFTAAIRQVEQEARAEQQRRQQARNQRQQQRPRHQ